MKTERRAGPIGREGDEGRRGDAGERGGTRGDLMCGRGEGLADQQAREPGVPEHASAPRARARVCARANLGASGSRRDREGGDRHRAGPEKERGVGAVG